MTDGKPNLKSMLYEVVQHTPETRAGVVDRLVGGDEGVRRELVALVDAWDRATAALDDGAHGGGVATLPRDRTGERVGAYELTELIGEGGFGLVYRAVQREPVSREVALKVLKPGMDSGAILARFDVERRALALLAHDAIARIYDAGSSADGRPYFAMELIEGEPITDYCDARALSIDSRLDLFARVCEAVHHAHQKGIIHRDLKPTNILVCETDRGAAPKVIDFGIAKALDEPLGEVSVLTLARQIVGTPLYMSPEQASLDAGGVDTRSDVFSLGAVLYELLCGTTPVGTQTLAAGGIGTLAEVLRRGEFPRPSVRIGTDAEAISKARGTDGARLRRSLAGDLDWVVMRAIEPDPARRYPSAAALAADIRRHRAMEPIEARPPTTGYLIHRFARRHRAGVAVASVVAAATVVLVAVLAAGFVSVRTQRDLARAAQAEEAAAREEADATLEYFLGVLTAPSGDRMGRSVTMLEAVEAAAATIDERTAGRPKLGARVHNATGNVFRVLGETRRAREHHERALELARSADGVGAHTVVSMLNDYALTLDDLGDGTGFRATLDEAMALAEAELEADDPARMVVACNIAGNVWIPDGRAGEAVAVLEPIASYAGELKADTRFTAMNNLSVALAELGREDEAVAWAERLLAETAGSGEQWSGKRMHALHTLAGIRYRAGDVAAAVVVYRRVLAETESQFGELSPNVLVVLNNIAAAEQQLGRYDDALATRDEASRRAGAMLPEGHPVFGRLASGRGNLLAAMERYEEAEAALLEAWSVFEAAGVPAPLLRESAADLAKLYGVMGRGADAALWAERAATPDEAVGGG